MKTKITKINADWIDVKNECRNTVNKEYSDKEATSKFKTNILISEHSPIRLVDVKWRWEEIKSWISVHFARHWLGWDKWISTQRDDRTGVDRNKSSQDVPVNYDGKANAQSLINVARYRLCEGCAHPETREYMEDLKISIKEQGETELSDVLVPNCIYRCGCPEFKCCGYIGKFIKWCKDNKEDFNETDLLNIHTRYSLYNEFFYTQRSEYNNERIKNLSRW